MPIRQPGAIPFPELGMLLLLMLDPMAITSKASYNMLQRIQAERSYRAPMA